MSSKRQLPPLSAAQQEIMEIVWQRGEISAFEVRDLLAALGRDVARNTVRTLMTRMEEKGWLQHRVVARTYFYSAKVPRETNLRQRVLDVLDSACGGSPAQLMSALMQYRGLSENEEAEIRQMLDQAKSSKRSKKGDT